MDKLSKLIGIPIDDVVCISLKQQTKRRNDTINECKSLGLTPKFRIVEKHKDPVRGCLESHIYCINWAKKNNLSNILIIEDDVKFDTKMINNIKPINIPKNWDMIYFGYNGNFGSRIDDNLIKLYSGFTTHCYLIRNTLFDYVLKNIDVDWNKNLTPVGFETKKSLELKAIDVFYAKMVHLKRKKTYGIYPMVAFQRPEYSAIENRYVDYTELLIKKANVVASNVQSKYLSNKNEYESKYDFYSNKNVNSDIVKQSYGIQKRIDWNTCYLDQQKSKWFERINNGDKKIYLFPGISTYKFDKELEYYCSKQILCFYGKIPKQMMHYLYQMKNYYIFVIGNKTEQKGNIYHITKEQYKFIPRHTMFLVNNTTYFFELPMKKAIRIILWIVDDFKNFVWNKLNIPNNNIPLIYNFRNKISNVIMSYKNEKIKELVNDSNIIEQNIPEHDLLLNKPNIKKTNQIFVRLTNENEFVKFHKQTNKKYNFIVFGKSNYKARNIKYVDNTNCLTESEFYLDQNKESDDNFYKILSNNVLYINQHIKKPCVINTLDNLDDKRKQIYKNITKNYFNKKCGSWFTNFLKSIK